MKKIAFFLSIILLVSCSSDDDSSNEPYSLTQHFQENIDLFQADLVACAGGKENGLFDTFNEPTTVFFYPIEGATDFRYFEATSVSDSMNFDKYYEKDLVDEPVFNGYLWKFINTDFDGERMGIVTYNTPGNLHVCQPIRLKTNIKPTEVDPEKASVDVTGVNPTFEWEQGIINENVIYFQVISDLDGNLISGTYTIEQNFTFYDLGNVVFNITDPDSNPTLDPNTEYVFTLMGVSEDNWVNLFSEFSFMTL